MREDFRHVLDVDALYMLVGWSNSEGACQEYMIARAIGTPVYFEKDGIPILPEGCQCTIQESEPSSAPVPSVILQPASPGPA